MQYLQPFLYFVRKPNTGYKNVLIGCLGTLVFVVGEIVLLGYRAKVSEELERDPDLKDHPDVDLDRLAVYLQRGIWPYLVKFLSLMFLMSIGVVISAIVGIGVYQIVQEPILAFGIFYLLYFVCFLLATTLVWPMEYHAQITGKFAPLADFRFAIRFARTCWVSTFKAVLMHTMLSGLTLMLGLVLCGVGLYPAIVIVQMAEQHLMTQLYLLYLEEGGEPLIRPEVFDESRRDEEFEDDEPLKRAKRVDPME